MKTSNFTCQAKSFSGIFFTYQVCELHPFSCHVLAKYDIYSQTAESVLSHLNLSPQKKIKKITFPPPPPPQKKILKWKISHPKKSFNHPRHLKSGVLPLGPLLSSPYFLTSYGTFQENAPGWPEMIRNGHFCS